MTSANVSLQPQQHPFLAAAEQFDQQTALISIDVSMTYTDLIHRSRIWYRKIIKRFPSQNPILVLDDLSAKDLITGIWTAALGGLVAFPLNTRYPVRQREEILKSMQPAIILSRTPWQTDRWLHPETMDQPNEEPFPDWPPFNTSEAATLLMTSGSSGKPKLVEHTLGNHLASARGSLNNIPLEPGDRWLAVLPFYHVGGLSILYRCALSGAAVLVPENQSAIIDMAVEQQATHISLVATQLQRLMQQPGAMPVLRQFKTILLGGSAIPTALIQQALDDGLPILTSYGSTEMASQITTTDPADRKSALNSSGKVLPDREVLIAHTGEILVKGNTLARGYREDTRLLDLRDEQGWFHTGDVGYLDAQGHLSVTGRLDNQFISGGENIQPEYIEHILHRFPGIVQALVLPLPDPEFGFRPIALIQSSDNSLTSEKLISSLRTSLPGYMLPVAFYRWPEELDSGNLKPDRQALKEFITHSKKVLEPLDSAVN